MERQPRGFEHVKHAPNDIPLPTRADPYSAGYDFYSPEDIFVGAFQVVTIPTGIKAYMLDDEYLQVHIRSSMGIKHGLVMMNAVGIIDSSYYGNETNDGEISLCILNTRPTAYIIKKGDRVAQGIFSKYLTVGDTPVGTRTGGIGSSGS